MIHDHILESRLASERAAVRQADALERIATAFESIAKTLSDYVYSKPEIDEPPRRESSGLQF